LNVSGYAKTGSAIGCTVLALQHTLKVSKVSGLAKAGSALGCTLLVMQNTLKVLG
jgi:hypothetical protein